MKKLRVMTVVGTRPGYRDVRSLSGGTMTFCAWHGAGICEGTPETPVLSYAEEKAPAAPAPAAVKTIELDVYDGEHIAGVVVHPG